jgi:predicted secreted Zn-dependent protease
MRGFLIGFSVSLAFIVGCVAGSTRYGVPKAEAAAVVEQRWSYFCFDASSVDDVNFKANAAGMRGWELVTSAPSASAGQSTWCFRQPRP